MKAKKTESEFKVIERLRTSGAWCIPAPELKMMTAGVQIAAERTDHPGFITGEQRADCLVTHYRGPKLVTRARRSTAA